MTEWILIVLTGIAMPYVTVGGATVSSKAHNTGLNTVVTMQEFVTKPACESASATIEKYSNSKCICMPKR